MISAAYIETVRDRVRERDIDCTDQHILECLKYLAIMSGTNGRRIAVTPDVDEVWHELIVQTQSYDELCSLLPGSRFIHHESITPAAYEDRVGSDEFVDEFLRWVPDYVHNFGKFDENRAQHWTVIQFLRATVGLSLEEINQAGKESDPEVTLPASSSWRALSSDQLECILY